MILDNDFILESNSSTDLRKDDYETSKEYLVPLDKLMSLLEQHLGKNTEIVYHDMTLPYEHTIVDIRHGDITGREIGGCGSNLGLEVIRGTTTDGDRFNYITHTNNGRILRSSSVYIYDHGQPVGAICINTDLSETMRMEKYFREFNGYTDCYNNGANDGDSGERFAQNVSELLDFFMQEAQKVVGVPAPLMNREEKIRFIDLLDKKGAFLISKSSEHVCSFINVSKYTLYNYLDCVRNNAQKMKEDKNESRNENC